MKRRLFDAITLYFTAIAVFRLLDVEVFPCFVWSSFITFPYDWIVGTAFRLLEISLPFDIAIPDPFRSGVVIWLAVGRLVRKFVSGEEEQWKENAANADLSQPQTQLEKFRSFIRNPHGWLKGWWSSPYTKEKVWFTIFPPWRIFVDLKGGFPAGYKIDKDGKRIDPEYDLTIYWSLTPLTIVKYSVAAFACVLISRIMCEMWIRQ